jgi:hypothetical protein
VEVRYPRDKQEEVLYDVHLTAPLPVRAAR